MIPLLAPAHAHVPHDPVTLVAALLEEDPLPWFAVSQPDSGTLLLRSQDRGESWEIVGGAPTADTLVGAAALSDGTKVLLGEGRTWWTEDGETWQEAGIPADIELMAGEDDLVLAGPGGVWTGAPGGRLIQELEAEIVALGPGGAALSADGHVWRRLARTWRDEGAPGPALISVAAGSGGLYAGSESGAVWRLGATGWQECTPLPGAGRARWPQVVTLATMDDLVLAATAVHAVFVGSDDCTAWADHGVGDETQYDTSGAAESIGAAWPALLARDERWVVGGWAGLYVSEDAGLSWSAKSLIPADYTRGLALGANFLEHRRVVVGAYGSGPLVTTDGGESWTASASPGLPSNAQGLDVSDEDDGTVWGVLGHAAWTSADGGVSWETFDAAPNAAEIIAWESDLHLWTISADGARETWDGGETWEELAELEIAIAPAHAAGGFGFTASDGASWLCAPGAAPPALACSVDGGPWTREYLADESPSTLAAAPWPATEATHVVAGDDEGVHLLDLATGAWTHVTLDERDPVRLLVNAGDEALFLATASGRILRSDDGGVTWSAVGERLSAHAFVMVARPDWEAHPDLLIATHDGLWRVQGDGVPERWGRYQRVDTQSPLAECDGCGDAEARDDAGMGEIQPLAVGARIDLRLRGDRIRVLGTSIEGGAARVEVDGTSFDLGGDAVGVLLELEGLGEGWHEVSVSSVAEGVAIDAIDAENDSSILEFDVEEPGAEAPASRCGCGGRAFVAIFGVFGVVRRRAGAGESG